MLTHQLLMTANVTNPSALDSEVLFGCKNGAQKPLDEPPNSAWSLRSCKNGADKALDVTAVVTNPLPLDSAGAVCIFLTRTFDLDLQTPGWVWRVRRALCTVLNKNT